MDNSIKRKPLFGPNGVYFREIPLYYLNARVIGKWHQIAVDLIQSWYFLVLNWKVYQKSLYLAIIWRMKGVRNELWAFLLLCLNNALIFKIRVTRKVLKVFEYLLISNVEMCVKNKKALNYCNYQFILSLGIPIDRRIWIQSWLCILFYMG